MNLRRVLLSSIAALTVASMCHASLKVDFNADNDRKDMLSTTCENWTISDGASASKSFGEIKLTVRVAGGTVAGDMWKGGIDHNSRLANDGVFARDGRGSLELVIEGLSPGKHSIATFHNTTWAQPGVPLDVLVDGKPTVAGVKPTMRVESEYDTATAYVEVNAEAGKQIVLSFKPASGNGPVMLNGIEIDRPNPAARATRPMPANFDEHTPVGELNWTPAPGAMKNIVYLGTSSDALERLGETTQAKIATNGLSNLKEYYWRVDGVGADGKVSTGDVWKFRPAHLAFPGAEGYGRYAIGGRGGKVYEVTNLNDSGPGSLREGVEADGPRTIVFRVGGTIKLKSKLLIRNPYLTIAGQTAPGDGICIGGYTFGHIGSHDTILRYIRIRVGDESGQTMDGTGFPGSDHCIMDHCSVSWSQDEAVSSRNGKNITVQRCIVADALNIAGHRNYRPGTGHGYAGSISGNIGSFHHNLIANCAGRNWSLAGGFAQRGDRFAGYLDIRNNVCYNWVHRTTDGGVRAVNFTGNYYIPGPATKVFHFVIARIEHALPNDIQQFYVEDNIMEGYPQYDADNWQNGGVRYDPKDLPGIKLTKPFCESHITEHSAKEAYENVMADVGANHPKLDPVDARVVRDVARRSFTYKGSVSGLPGVIDSQKDSGGFPELKSGPAPADSDHDGMPDEWEKAHKLNPSDPSDGPKDSGDGYTNLEKYLNGIVATHRQG